MLENLFFRKNIRQRVTPIVLDTLEDERRLLWGQEPVLVGEIGNKEPRNDTERDSDSALDNLRGLVGHNISTVTSTKTRCTYENPCPAANPPLPVKQAENICQKGADAAHSVGKHAEDSEA
ncbi:hypothetical protein H0H81_009590, partial [Sphagnurus paluster]